MNKAILVLEEMPDTCFDCPFRKEHELVYIGDYTYKQYYRCGVRLMKDDFILEDIRHEKPDWCPLKEAPERRKREYGDEDFFFGYNEGWNDCIYELLHEEN